MATNETTTNEVPAYIHADAFQTIHGKSNEDLLAVMLRFIDEQGLQDKFGTYLDRVAHEE